MADKTTKYGAFSDRQKNNIKEAVHKYDKKTYDKILVRVRKDEWPTRDDIREAAKSCGMTMSGFMIEATKEKMKHLQ